MFEGLQQAKNKAGDDEAEVGGEESAHEADAAVENEEQKVSCLVECSVCNACVPKGNMALHLARVHPAAVDKLAASCQADEKGEAVDDGKLDDVLASATTSMRCERCGYHVPAPNWEIHQAHCSATFLDVPPKSSSSMAHHGDAGHSPHQLSVLRSSLPSSAAYGIVSMLSKHHPASQRSQNQSLSSSAGDLLPDNDHMMTTCQFCQLRVPTHNLLLHQAHCNNNLLCQTTTIDNPKSPKPSRNTDTAKSDAHQLPCSRKKSSNAKTATTKTTTTTRITSTSTNSGHRSTCKSKQKKSTPEAKSKSNPEAKSKPRRHMTNKRGKQKTRRPKEEDRVWKPRQAATAATRTEQHVTNDGPDPTKKTVTDKQQQTETTGVTVCPHCGFSQWTEGPCLACDCHPTIMGDTSHHDVSAAAAAAAAVSKKTRPTALAASKKQQKAKQKRQKKTTSNRFAAAAAAAIPKDPPPRMPATEMHPSSSDSSTTCKECGFSQKTEGPCLACGYDNDTNKKRHSSPPSSSLPLEISNSRERSGHEEDSSSSQFVLGWIPKGIQSILSSTLQQEPRSQESWNDTLEKSKSPSKNDSTSSEQMPKSGNQQSANSHRRRQEHTDSLIMLEQQHYQKVMQAAERRATELKEQQLKEETKRKNSERTTTDHSTKANRETRVNRRRPPGDDNIVVTTTPTSSLQQQQQQQLAVILATKAFCQEQLESIRKVEVVEGLQDDIQMLGLERWKNHLQHLLDMYRRHHSSSKDDATTTLLIWQMRTHFCRYARMEITSLLELAIYKFVLHRQQQQPQPSSVIGSMIGEDDHPVSCCSTMVKEDRKQMAQIIIQGVLPFLGTPQTRGFRNL